MALLSRLFSSRKNKQAKNLNGENNDRSPWKPFAFNKDQVRVLLFRECDWRGRKLLFDSNAVEKVPLESSCKLRFTGRPKLDKSKKDGFVEITNGYGYQYTKPSADAKLLGEMMFGAVAMTFRGAALKVHAIPNPGRLMCTKVFPSPESSHPNKRTSDKSLEDSFGSSMNSMIEYSSRSGSESILESAALDVPPGASAGAYNLSAGDSGFCGDFSLRSVSSVGSSDWTSCDRAEARSSVGSLPAARQSGGSLSSLQRRWGRSVSTSLELGPRRAEDSAAGGCCDPHHRQRRTKLGLAVLVTLTEEQHREMEAFLFEHMSVVECQVERLRHAAERAYARKDVFVHVMHEGWRDAQQALHDMLCLPRLPCPLWLRLGLGGGGGGGGGGDGGGADGRCRAGLAASFVQDLCHLVATLDTKATNFFVSTLVTGVLTHHLGWVNTVWPQNGPLPNAAGHPANSQSLHDLSRSHPYNPLWAQLSDLYGALGSPTKIAKTIVTANPRRADCVNKLLTSLTYFIRCGEVKEATNLTLGHVDLHVENTCSSSSATLKDSESSVTVCGQFGNCQSASSGGFSKSSVSLAASTSSLSKGAFSELIASPSQARTGSDIIVLSPIQTSSSNSCGLNGKVTDLPGFVNSPPNMPVPTNSNTFVLKTEQLENRTSGSATVDISSETWVYSLGLQEEKNSNINRILPTNGNGDSAFTASPASLENLDRASCRSAIYMDDSESVLNTKLDGYSGGQEFCQDKEFKAHDLKSGNFCSPAGVEWEVDENRTGDSGRDTLERDEIIKSRLTCNGIKTEDVCGEYSASSPHANDIGSLPSRNGCDASEGCVILRKVAETAGGGIACPSSHTAFQVGDPFCYNEQSRNVVNTEPCTLRNQNIGRFKIAPSSLTQDNGDNVEIRSDSSKAMSHSGGLRSMKRTSSCRKKLSDMTENRGIGLYPDIGDLARMENIRLDDGPYLENTNHDRDFRIENCSNTLDRSLDISPNMIAEKVSKLSRVPTSAVMFHLEKEETEDMCTSRLFECVDVKRFDCERQMAAVGVSERNSKATRSRDHVDGGQSEVLFVLGDNEQLIGIKHHSATHLDVARSADACAPKSISENSLQANVSSQYASRGNSFQQSEPKVVTVKSSYIDVEVESGLVSADDGQKSHFKLCVNRGLVDCVNDNEKDSILRSSSINLPIMKRKRIKKQAKSRRYTEIYCDKCKIILKENRNENLNERDVEKVFLSCEKCYYSNRDQALDAMGVFHRTKSEKSDLNLIEGHFSGTSSSQEDESVSARDASDIESSLEMGVTIEKLGREGNAMFEQYNPSDEEILGARSSKAKPHLPEAKEFGFMDLHLVKLPLPSCRCVDHSVVGLAASLLGGVSGRYVPDLVLQGCCSLPAGWEAALRRDLALAAKLPLLGQDVAEAVCLVADTNTWEVQLVSSHAYVVDRAGSFGVRVGMSQLVANMLESLVHLWRLKMPAEQCLQHLEGKLRELFARSQALAELLLTTEFCNMALLTTALDLEANDVPLLLAVASTHTPQIASRYGLSFI